MCLCKMIFIARNWLMIVGTASDYEASLKSLGWAISGRGTLKTLGQELIFHFTGECFFPLPGKLCPAVQAAHCLGQLHPDYPVQRTAIFFT